MALVDKISKSDMNGPYGRQGSTNGGQPGEVFVIPGAVQDLAKPKLLGELGVSGLLRTRGVGYVYEEWLRDLSTYRQKQVYREMRDNDAVIGAIFFALEMILRKAEWRVEPGEGPKSIQYAEFLEQCMEDMSHTWEDFVAECVNMFAFGFSLFETCYKRRLGPDGRQGSKYDDGLIGWRKHAPRAQESILYWIWDDEGGLQGAVQLAAPDYHTVPMPIEKLLLFRTTSLKNNPEGRSLLRNVYRSWFFKRRIEEVEGIGIERDLCGIPVLKASAEALEAMGGMAAAMKLVSNIRVDDQAGVVLPMAYDEKGNPLVTLELMKAAGAKQTDPNATIGRYNSDILNTVLAGFVQFGQTPTGSRSMHMSATQIFSLAISAFMDSVAAVMNRIAIPRLCQLNKFDLKQIPTLVPGEIGVRDLEELSQYVFQLSQSGLSFIDKPTQDYIRKVGRLPEMPDDAETGYNPNQAQGGPDDPGAQPPAAQENGEQDQEQNPQKLPAGQQQPLAKPAAAAPGAVDPKALLQTLNIQMKSGAVKYEDVQRMLNTYTQPHPAPAKA